MLQMIHYAATKCNVDLAVHGPCCQNAARTAVFSSVNGPGAPPWNGQ